MVVPLFHSASSHLHTLVSPQSIIIISFTTGELERLHRQFFRPEPTKRFNLLRRTNIPKAENNPVKILNDISSLCDRCKRVSSAPLHFRAYFGSDYALFNERIFIDIFYIIKKKTKNTTLHIIDEGTNFSATNSLKNMKTNKI